MSCDSYADLMGQPMPIEVVGGGRHIFYWHCPDLPTIYGTRLLPTLDEAPLTATAPAAFGRFASGSPTLADVRPRTAGWPIASTSFDSEGQTRFLTIWARPADCRIRAPYNSWRARPVMNFLNSAGELAKGV